MSIPPQIIVQAPRSTTRRARPRRWPSGAAGAVELRAAERGDKRRILDLAERNAQLALDQEQLKTERRRQQRVEALDGLQDALGARRAAAAHRVLRHLQPDGHPQGRLDGRLRGRRAEEVRLPALHASAATRRACPTTSPRWPRCCGRRLAQWERQEDLSPHDPKRDESFAALPNLIVIDGGPGQLSAGLRALEGFRAAASRSSRWPSASRRSSVPGVREPLALGHDTPELQLLQRVRDEAHRFAITHHRGAPRPGDDRRRSSTTCRASAPRASARCSSTSARPRRSWPPRARSSRRCPGCRARSRATSTRAAPDGRLSRLTAVHAPSRHGR